MEAPDHLVTVLTLIFFGMRYLHRNPLASAGLSPRRCSARGGDKPKAVGGRPGSGTFGDG